MAKRQWVDLVVRGVRYPTAAAVASKFGVTAEHVRHAAREGKLDQVGAGRGGAAPMSVLIAGRLFPSAKAAAAHFGVTVTAIYKALAAGDPDRVARPALYGGGVSKPFVLGGLSFRSHEAASRALGFGPSYLRNAIWRRSEHAMGRILAAAMRLRAAEDRKAALAVERASAAALRETKEGRAA